MLQVVESVLNDFDWVFYLDSDAWITNPQIPLETLLPAQGGADFVVTEDAAGANAGAWIIRSSDWSRAFLKEWWGLESFVRVHLPAPACAVAGSCSGLIPRHGLCVVYNVKLVSSREQLQARCGARGEFTPSARRAC